MTTPNPVIITDGLWRKSLSAIRSLGKSGFQIHVMGNSLFTIGFWSRFSSRRVKAPLASENAEAFGNALIRYLDTLPSQNPPVLFLMEDPTLLWASKNRSQLEKRALFVLPSEKSLEVASDKSLTLRLAEKIGAPMPRTFWPSHPDEIDHLLTTHFDQAEWVIKPVQGSGSKGILYGAGKPFSKTEFIEKIRTHWTEHGPLLLQERIPATGRGIGASFLMNRDGNVVAEFLHERIQQYPVSGGPSTDRVSIHHPEIKDWSLKLLRELSWQGIAMVEWKSDPRDGRFKLMEINPRFWGSLELAVRAGVDFPKLYAEVCLGHPLAAYPPAYPDGVRCRWMMPGEILRYLSTPKDQRESIPAFLKGLPARAEEWDTKDLRGALATIICTFCLALNPRYWKYLRRG